MAIHAWQMHHFQAKAQRIIEETARVCPVVEASEVGKSGGGSGEDSEQGDGEQGSEEDSILITIVVAKGANSPVMVEELAEERRRLRSDAVTELALSPKHKRARHI